VQRATDLDVNVQKLFCIGKESDNKVKPLLICLESETEKQLLLSRAPKLRFFTQYKKVYIAPDITRFQRTKHRKLVDELKRRKQQGEQNRIIKNGSIVRREHRAQPMLDSVVPSPVLIDLNISEQCT